MVTDQQVRKLMKLIQSEKSLAVAAAKSGMDEKTAGKYRRLERLPSQCQRAHTWMTRQDRFAEAWPEIRGQLQLNPGLEGRMISGAHVRERTEYRREREGAIRSKRVDMLWIWSAYSCGDEFLVIAATSHVP